MLSNTKINFVSFFVSFFVSLCLVSLTPAQPLSAFNGISKSGDTFTYITTQIETVSDQAVVKLTLINNSFRNETHEPLIKELRKAGFNVTNLGGNELRAFLGNKTIDDLEKLVSRILNERLIKVDPIHTPDMGGYNLISYSGPWRIVRKRPDSNIGIDARSKLNNHEVWIREELRDDDSTFLSVTASGPDSEIEQNITIKFNPNTPGLFDVKIKWEEPGLRGRTITQTTGPNHLLYFAKYFPDLPEQIQKYFWKAILAEVTKASKTAFEKEKEKNKNHREAIERSRQK